MEAKGLQIIATKDGKRADEICNYIWSLNFKKQVMIDVSVAERATDIQAKVTRTRYFIYVNPNMKFEDIKAFLLKKGYITD